MAIHSYCLSTVYADESDDQTRFVLTFVNVPTIEIVEPENAWDTTKLRDVWNDFYQMARGWRQHLKDSYGIPIKKELKGRDLAKGRNRYRRGIAPIYGPHAIRVYKDALSKLGFLPDRSIFSVCTSRGYMLYGQTKLEASLHAAFQRIQKQNIAADQTSLLMFDEGHSEYRKLYRRACKYLPTGSSHGHWSSGKKTKNSPLSTAIKDANFKDSRESVFIQIADLVAYATLMKIKSERGALTAKEARHHLGDLHDSIPRRILNEKVENGGTDGIKRLG